MARLLIVEDNQELASLIVAAAQSRGHEARAVHTGGGALALLGSAAFDIVVVDLLLPDMHGNDVLAALQRHAVPAVAISGIFKGSPFAREATQVHGARAFFEKPFELLVLLESIEKLCGLPSPPQPAPQEHDEEIMELVELALPEGDEPLWSSSSPSAAPRRKAPEAPPSEGPDPGLALPFAEREKVWAKTSEPGDSRRALPEWLLAGDLKGTTIPRLLNAYYEARHNGELKLRQDNILKVIYFEAGRPICAASNLTLERFGRFCVRRGVLTESRFQEVAHLVRERKQRTGELMVQLGIIDEEQRQHLLQEQVKEIIWTTFSWSEGAYGFSPLRSSRAGLVKLSVFPGDIILEGVLKTEPLIMLRQRMPPPRRLFPVTAPPYDLYELKLDDQQARLLAYTDGTKTVADLLTLMDLSEREALATLHALEMLGVLEERREHSNRRIAFGL